MMFLTTCMGNDDSRLLFLGYVCMTMMISYYLLLVFAMRPVSKQKTRIREKKEKPGNAAIILPHPSMSIP